MSTEPVEDDGQELPGLTRRVTVRLPIRTLEEVDRYVEESGTTRPNFLAMSLVIGARALHMAVNPESALTPSVIQQMTDRMLSYLMQPDILAKIAAIDVLPSGLPVAPPE